MQIKPEDCIFSAWVFHAVIFKLTLIILSSELGDTTLGCDSTGGHYNQEMMAHGDRTNTTRHVGDLGNIVSDLDGTAQLNFTVDKVSLFRKESNSVFG